MGPRTPCPHPIRLRLFVREPAHADGTDRVREHLEQCESCRSVVAEIECGFAEETQHTLVDVSMAQSGRSGFFHDPREDVRLNDDGPVITTISMTVDPPKEPADRELGFQVSEATKGASRGITSDSMTTCEIAPGDDSDTGLFVLSDAATAGESSPAHRIKSDSITTCEILPGDDLDTGSFVMPGASGATRRQHGNMCARDGRRLEADRAIRLPVFADLARFQVRAGFARGKAR